MAVNMIVEDGSGKSDANSYASLADATEYFDNRNDTAWAGLATDDARAAALIEATQYIDAGWDFYGEIANDEQALAWPRYNATDRQGRAIDHDEIPPKLKEATFEAAYKAGVDGVDLMTDQVGDRVAEEEVHNAVRVKYDTATNTSANSNVFSLVDALLKGLGIKTGAGGVMGSVIQWVASSITAG